MALYNVIGKNLGETWVLATAAAVLELRGLVTNARRPMPDRDRMRHYEARLTA